MKQLFLVLVTLMFAANAAQSQTGNLPADLDSSFGSNGDGIVHSTPSEPNFYRVAVDANSNIFVTQSNSIAKYKPDGEFEGSVFVPFIPMALAVSGSNIITVGSVFSGGKYVIAMVRFSNSLIQDMTFGNNGMATSSLQGDLFHRATDIAIVGSDIVVTGYATNSSNDYEHDPSTHQFVAKFTFRGKKQSAFNTTGYVIEPAGTTVGDSVITDGNLIYVGGRTMRCSSSIDCTSDISVYHLNGALSTRFAKQKTFGNTPTKLAMQSDGSIIATGMYYRLRRVLPNGTIDAGYSGTLINYDPYNGGSNLSIRIDALDRVIVLGSWAQIPDTDAQAYVARYEINGRLDVGFNSKRRQLFTGTVMFNFGQPGLRILPGGLALQGDKIIVTAVLQPGQTTIDGYLARLNGN
jgi:Domain of unknown function (DUF5122) beta-propeller